MGRRATIRGSIPSTTGGGIIKMKTKLTFKDSNAQQENPSNIMNRLGTTLGIKLNQQIKQEVEEAQPLVSKETIMPQQRGKKQQAKKAFAVGIISKIKKKDEKKKDEEEEEKENELKKKEEEEKEKLEH